MSGERVMKSDILRIAKYISPNDIFQIAMEHLDLDKIEYDRARADTIHVGTLQFHYECIEKWKLNNGSKATKDNLYKCLQKASENGLLEKSKIEFLVEQVFRLTYSWLLLKGNTESRSGNIFTFKLPEMKYS